MKAARLTGHIRDVAPHPEAVHHSAILGAVQVPELIKLPALVVEQHGSNCTDFGYGHLPDTWCRARGLGSDRPSPRGNYTLGRCITAADFHAPISDDGAMPADVIEGMRSIGVVPESVCQGDTADVINQRLDFAVIQDACQWRVDGIANIPEAGAERCAAIRRALANRFPVGFGMNVDEAYMNWRGDVPYSAFDPARNRGGHAQRIIGAKPGAFLIAGSWADWGLVDATIDGSVALGGGLIWIADSVIGDPNVCWDFYLVSAAPIVREAT